MKYNILKFDATFKKTEDIEKIAKILAKPQYQQIPIKTAEEIEKLKISGSICANILDEISPFVIPGVTKKKLNDLIQDLICNKYSAEVDRLETDVETDASDRISACFGHNNVIVNAEPDNIPLQTGDIFGLILASKKMGGVVIQESHGLLVMKHRLAL